MAKFRQEGWVVVIVAVGYSELFTIGEVPNTDSKELLLQIDDMVRLQRLWSRLKSIRVYFFSASTNYRIHHGLRYCGKSISRDEALLACVCRF